MTQIGWSKAVQKAIEAGVEVREVTMSGCVVGLEIGGRVVRHWNGWYQEAQVDEAVSASKRKEAA